MAREFDRNYFNRERLEYKEEIDWVPTSVFKEERWKRVCEAWYGVRLNVLVEWRPNVLV